MNTDTTKTLTDPVCGMTVSPDKAAGSYEYKGEQYYFCSKSCLAKFTADPQSFLTKQPAGMPAAETSEDSYRPLIVIILLIAASTAALAFGDLRHGDFGLDNVLRYFMTGFFLVFAGFKLIDLKGFAEGYSTYDLIAQRWYGYGYVYPFIELAFGLAMLAGFESRALYAGEFIVMAFSGVGVAIKIAKKERFQCACLGTFLKVPLTKVTIVEDFGMAALALAMLLMHR
jgi:YHS domain-containing protein